MDANPYESPADVLDTDTPPDRAARTALAQTIRQFLDARISAFAFDEALDPFRGSSDSTVRFVAQAVWYYYDDCTDHMVTLSKPEWDYFQRLLLLLESDGQIITTSARRWSWTQLVALGCLIALGWLTWQSGWGPHLWVLSIPFGLVSMALAFLRNRNRSSAVYDPILTPFSSFAELSDILRKTAGFTKQRYPGALSKRRIRSPVAEFGIRLQFFAGWLLFSPIPLLVQSFPRTETRTEVKAT